MACVCERMSDSDNEKLPIVVACSGGNPEGQLSDLIARRLQDEGLARMVSLSGLIGNFAESSLVATARQVIFIDGCHSGCSMQSASLSGYDDCEHVDLIAVGIAKPGSAPTEAMIERGVKHVSKLLATGKR